MKAWINHLIMLLKLLAGRFDKLVAGIFRTVVFTVSLGALVLLAFSIGFDLPEATRAAFFTCCLWILAFFVLAYAFRILFSFKEFVREKGFTIELLLFLTLLAVLIARHSVPGPAPAPALLWLRSELVVYLLTAVLSIIEVSKGLFGVMQQALNPSLLFAYSFLFFILLGAALLLLPNSSVQKGSLSFLDALFTSVSAVCITGIGVIDVATELTLTGQVITLALAQVGAIGVMTFTSFFAMSFMGASSFHNQMMLKDLLVEDRLDAIFRTMFRILLVTFSAELAGSVAIFFAIHGTLSCSLQQEIWYAVFHSVSAFCNSGISLFPGNLQNELVQYNYTLHTCIALLVVLGGLGFPILFNYGRLFRHSVARLFHRLLGHRQLDVHERILTVNTRLSIITTFWLNVGGWLLFFLFENHHTMQGLPLSEKLAASFFGAVTPRAAGVHTIDMSTLASPTLILTRFLMWVGASPRACGGGIKTTTLAVAVLTAVSVVRGRRRIEVSSREIAESTVWRAFAVIGLSLVLIVVVAVLLACLEPRMQLGTVLFHAVSVLSTAGLTLHDMVDFSTASKIVLIVSMFVGRVGAVSLLTGFLRKSSPVVYSYPKETVMVG